MPVSVRVLTVLAFALSACVGSGAQTESVTTGRPSGVAAGTVTQAFVPPRCGVIAGAGLLEIRLSEAPAGYTHDTMLVIIRCMGDSDAAMGPDPLEGRRVRFNVAPLDALPAEKRYDMFAVAGVNAPGVSANLPLYGLLDRVGAEEFEPEWVDS